ncbi:MAG: hypothetical protein ACOYON_13850 [Fimbriimonas sp.]
MKLSQVNLRTLFLTMVAMCLVVPMSFGQAPTTKPPKATKPSVAKKSPKTLPARDPKTGRFVKKAAKVEAKKGPARDPKTGRFVKKK